MGDITSLRCVSVISSISTAYGGPAIGSVMLNSALNQMGVAATLLTAGYPVGSTLDSAEIAWINTITTKKVRYLSPSRSHFMQSSWEMLAELRELAGHVDWIHIHCRYRMPELYAYTVATKAGVPYGLQPHGVLEPYQRRTSRWKKSAYDTIIGRKVIENASYVLFGSQEEADNASDLVRPEQALVAPLGAHLDPPLRPATMDEVEQGNRMGNVLFLGRLARKKRADTLVDAWAGITADDAQLIIAGPDGDFRGAEPSSRWAGSTAVRRRGFISSAGSSSSPRRTRTSASPSPRRCSLDAT
jgi:glycosyltransferase involved in cell wall biosynthesis